MNIAILMFFVCALLAVAGAVVLILAHEPIHSALALVLVMMALAVLYLLLGAPFIAAVQVIVYAGAVMVLFTFVVMLLNADREERTLGSHAARIVGLDPDKFTILIAASFAAVVAARLRNLPVAVGVALRFVRLFFGSVARLTQSGK